MEQGSSGQPFYLNDADTVTVDQLKTSDLRSLGDNVKLLAVIQNLSHDLVTKSENTYKKLDEIQCETEIKSVGVKNLINEFQMLADSQFIENRIYDADQTDLAPEEPTKSIIEKENSKTPPDQKILPIIHECISNSLKFIDENFNLGDKQLKQSTESDDEEDYVKETLARAMESNPFNKKPLPAIIGSQAFFNQNIFNDGDNRVPISQNDSHHELSSDKNSSISDESDEDSDLLFSPDKTISIKPGVIPPPPPMPNFNSMPDNDDKSEDGAIFPTNKPKIVQPQVMPKPPSLTQRQQFIDESEDEDEDLFHSGKTTSVPPRIIPKNPALPALKHNDSSDDEDDDLFPTTKTSTIPPKIDPQSPVLQVLKSIEHSDDSNDSDKNDDDNPFSQSNSGNLSAAQPKITKPLSTSQVDNNLFSHNNSNNASAAQPKINEVVPSLLLSKPISEKEGYDEDSDDLFKPPAVKPRNSIAALQNTSKPSLSTTNTLKNQPETKPKIWDLDSDDDDDNVDDLFSHHNSNKSPATQPKINEVVSSLPLSKPLVDVDNDDEDSDDLFKPPKVKPRSSIASLQEKPKTASGVDSLKDHPEKKVNIWELDSDDDDEKLFPTTNKQPIVQPRVMPQLPSLTQRKPFDESDDDDDDLFSAFSLNSR